MPVSEGNRQFREKTSMDPRTFENNCPREGCELGQFHVGFLQVIGNILMPSEFCLILFELNFHLINYSKETTNYKQQLHSVRIQNASLEQGQRKIQQEMVRYRHSHFTASFTYLFDQ